MSEENQFWIKFRGVRGGYPTPGPGTIKYGGNTTCFEIHAGKHLIIVDAGTGIIGLGQEMMRAYLEQGEKLQALLLLTHMHHDHTQGYPFFTPLLHPKGKFTIFGPRPLQDQDLEQTFNRVMEPPVSPVGLEEVRSRLQFSHIHEGDLLVWPHHQNAPTLLSQHEDQDDLPPYAVTIHTHRGYHHPRVGVLIYRIAYRGKSIVIATDTEGYIGVDRRLAQFAEGADLLVHDAEYDEHEYADDPIVKQGWGHSTWRMATDVAKMAHVQQLTLTHHSPYHDDAYLDAMEQKAQQDFPNTQMAREGTIIQLLRDE